MKIYSGKNIKTPENLDFLYEKKYVKRGGIVPFVIDRRGDTYILLGLSKDNRPVWADLGGRTEKGETSLETAIREYLEESRAVLPLDLNKTTKIIITNVRKNSKQIIMFVNIDLNEYTLNIDSYFQKTVPKTKYEDEMSELRWIKYEDFMNMNEEDLSKSLKVTRKVLKEIGK